MAVVLAELKIELETDPNAYGYAPHIASGQMQPLADLLNVERGDVPTQLNTTASHAFLQSVLDMAEYLALPSVRQLLWNAYTLSELDLVKAPGIKTKIEELFGSTGVTVSRLPQVWTRTGTRAEELWGGGTVVSWQDCAAALAL